MLERPLVKTNRFIKNLLYFIIASNLIMTVAIFLKPRLIFLSSHPGFSHKQIQLSPGSSDLPNVFQESFSVSYKILEDISEKSIIVFINLLSEIRKEPAYAVFYPRNLMWDYDINFAEKIDKHRDSNDLVVVFKGSIKPDLCKEKITKRVASDNIFICLN